MVLRTFRNLFKDHSMYSARTLILSLIAAASLIQPLSAAETGQKAPDCALTDQSNGQRHPLTELQGKVIYVDFWASWCPPCAKSFPFLNELHHQFHDQGLEILGVNLDENSSDAQEFLAQNPAHFAIMTDPDQQCAKLFDVKAMPSSYLVDRNGVIHHIHLGFHAGDAEQLKSQVQQLLGTTSAQP